MKITTYFPISFISFFIVFGACKSGFTKKSASIEVSDTLYLAQQSYSNLYTDSLSLFEFFNQTKEYNIYEQEVFDFYINRKFSYAWFTEDGISEQAVHFVNKFKNTSFLLRDSSLSNKEIDSLVTVFWEEKFLLKENKELIQRTELLLTSHFFKFIQKTYIGSMENLQSLSWYIPRKKLDSKALLEAMTNKKMDSMAFREPISPHYKKLKQQLVKFYELEKIDTQGVILIKESKLELGDSSSSVALIRAKLHLWGELAVNNTSSVFDEDLKNAVKKFQAKRGLAPDGTIGIQTLNAINVSMHQVTRQILINLERLRWVPYELSGDYFVVNIPEFMLHIFENGKYLSSTEVIVGKTITSTVIFNDVIESVVFAPYWNVPSSIQRKEIEPAIRRNRRYLSSKNMERVSNGKIRQRPGPWNALGQVKFLFPNSYSIYLHDTPTKDLFEETKRSFSHGCIRVKNPQDIASFLLKDQTEWTSDSIDIAMNASEELTVKVQRPVQIFITYFTAWVDREGNLQLREDIYGHDKKLANVLFEKEI
jgi:murein L,D-transpeptidase YcbB/YkuD